ncbi:MAG: hypothetical protein H0W90_14960 [Actinobacteria bacterium]|nr:hypothetical protein [Actinomycetota bacterium]
MESRAEKAGARFDVRRIVVFGAVGGVVAGMMMAITEMIYGWASSAHTAWDAPMAIWAWVAGLNHFGQPANHVGPIILGLGGHMMNSMIAGMMFIALLSALRLRNEIATIMFGVAYGLLLWVIMRYGILPLRSSTKLLFTTSLVSPQWVWWLAHALLGMTAGGFYVAVSRARLRPLPRTPRLREQAPRAAA